MPWARGLVAVLISALVLGGIVTVALQMSGSLKPDLGSAPGLSAADVAALDQPYTDLRAGRIDAIAARLAGGDPGNAKSELARMRELLPSGEPVSSRLVGWTVAAGTDGRRLSGVREVSYPQHIVRVQTGLFRTEAAQAWQIADFYVNVATLRELAANRPTLAGKSAAHIGFVAAAVAIALFIWVTALAVLFWRNLGRRWVWLLFVVLGLTTFRMSIATGDVSFQLISFQLFGAGAMWSGSAFDPWVVSVSAPFGAFAFWLHRILSRGTPEPAV